MSDENEYRLVWSLPTDLKERFEYFGDLDAIYERVLELLQIHGNLASVELPNSDNEDDLYVYGTHEYLMWRPDEKHVGFVTGREVLKAIAEHEDVLFAHSSDVQQGNREF